MVSLFKSSPADEAGFPLIQFSRMDRETGVITPRIPSPMQEAFFREVHGGNGSILLEAVAGSGKSTSIIDSLAYVPESKSVTMLAFGKDVIPDLKEKLEDLKRITGRQFGKTFHSLGFGSILKKLNCSFRDVELDGKKLVTLFRASFGDAAAEAYGSFCSKLVGIAKGRGIGVLMPNEPATYFDIIDHHDLSLDSEDVSVEEAVNYAMKLLAVSNEAALGGNGKKPYLDFDDQIYLPILWNLKLWQNDVLYIDEAQDTNMARRALAKKALRPGGRLIAVGDSAQAIFGFTGADSDAMELIRKQFSCKKMPLTVSYRCPKVSVGIVKDYVAEFQVHESAKEGEVLSLGLKGTLARLTARDAILCRNTAPLIDLAFSIIASGRGCKVLGKDIGMGLVNLIKKQRASGIPDLRDKLESFRDKEVTRYLGKGEEGKAESITDRVASILAVIDALSARATVPSLITQLVEMFTDDKNSGVLTLSTVHKAKGKEWETVAICEPGLMPSKWARQEHQMRQERNLIYVARTRFKSTLIFMNGVDPVEEKA